MLSGATTTLQPNSRGYPRMRGFSLVELMIVIVILAIMMAVAVPGLRDYLASTRVSNAADELVADLLLARSEAASRGARAAVCPVGTLSPVACATSGTWSTGRHVFMDIDSNEDVTAGEAVIGKLQSGALTDVTIALSGAPDTYYLAFSPYGGLLPPGTTATFLICSTTTSHGRQVAVAQSGRPNVTRVTCP